MPPKRTIAASGIKTTKDGERVIPASVRADGTIRPERRVKQGYTPIEDVAAYKNEKVESFRSHQYGHKDYVPPGLAKSTESEDKKKRRRRKKGGAGEAGEAGEESKSATDVGSLILEAPGQEDLEKKARALKKKIRQAAELKERAAKGERLEVSQIAKIGMLETFQKELEELNIEDLQES